MVSGGQNLGAATLQLRADSKRLGKDLDQAEKMTRDRISAIGQRMTATGGVMLGASAPLVALAGVSVKAASDVEESMNAMNVQFGEGAQTIFDFGETSAQTVGLARADLYQSLTGIGAMLLKTGMSEKEAAEGALILTKRAADMASVFNTDVSDAMSAIQQGLRGETEAMMRYGASVHAANIDQHLLAQGIEKTTSDMTEAEKVMARMDVIMAETSRTHLDFANTQDSFANSTRIIQAQMVDLAAILGSHLLPILAVVTSTLKPLIIQIGTWAQENPELTKKLVLLGIAVVGVAVVLGTLLVAAGLIATGIAAIATGPVLLLIAGFAALAAGVGAVVWNFDDVKGAIDRIKPALEALMQGNLDPLVTLLRDFLGPQIDMARQYAVSLADAVQQRLNAAWQQATDILGPFADILATRFAPALEYGRDAVGWLHEKLEPLSTFMADQFGPQLQTIEQYASTMATTVEEKLNAAWHHTSDILTPLAEAMTTGFGPTLELVAQYTDSLATAVRDRFNGAWQRASDILIPLGDYIDSTFEPVIRTTRDAIGFVSDKLGPLQGYLTNAEGAVKALGVALALMLLPISGPVGLIMMIGKFALKFINLEEVMNNTVKPAIQWFTDNVLPKIKAVWEETVKPALEAFWTFLSEKLGKVWEDTLKPAFNAMVDFFNLSVAPAIEKIAEVGANLFSFMTGDFTQIAESTKTTGGGITSALQPVADLLLNSLVPAFMDIVNYVWPLIVETWNDALKPLWDELVLTLNEVVVPILRYLLVVFIEVFEAIMPVVEPVMKMVMETIQMVIEIIANILRFWLAIIRGDWEAAWEAVKAILAEGWDYIQNIFTLSIELVGALWDAFWKLLGIVLETAWLAIKGIVKGGWDAIVGLITFGIGLLKQVWEAGWNAIKQFIDTIWQNIHSSIDGSIKGVKNLWSSFWTGLGKVVDGAANAIKRPINRIIGFINKMIGAWNSIKFRIPRITLPSVTLGGGTFLGKKVPSKTFGGGSFGGGSFSVPSIPTVPRLAEGGIAMAPTLAQIAEEGKPEAIIPLDRLSDLVSNLNLGGPELSFDQIDKDRHRPKIEVTIEGNVLDGEDFVERVTDAILLRQRQGLLPDFG